MAAIPSSAVDLSRLPAPQVVATPVFAEILAELTADFHARLPGHDAFLASDPVMKLLEVAAYRELLQKAQVNDAARAVMLPFAGGADLDNLAAFYGLERLVVTPATETVPVVLESDADLRARLQLAPELLSRIGLTAGAYRALALTAAPSVRDVATIRRDGGQIDLVLLGRAGDGTVLDATVAIVSAAFRDDEGATQLTDIVNVRSATIVPYTATVRLRIRSGPDPELVRRAAEAEVRAYAADRHRIGSPVYRQGIEAAAKVGSVEVAIADGFNDLDPSASGAAYLTGLTITVEVVA